MKQQGLQLYSLNWSEFKDKLKTRCCSKIYDVVKINEFKEIRKKAEESVADFCDRFENAMLRASQVDSYDTRIKFYECMPDYIANKIELKFSLHACSLLTLLNAAVEFESLSKFKLSRRGFRNNYLNTASGATNSIKDKSNGAKDGADLVKGD